MASALTHAFVGWAVARHGSSLQRSATFCATTAAVSVLPDIDAVGFWLGVPYGSPFGHRGFTHSLVFAAVVASAIAAVHRRADRVGKAWPWNVWGLIFLATASHGVLDALTDGGRGIAFLWPFDDGRYFFPFRPVHVSPIGVSRFFDGRAWRILSSEALWIWLPVWLLALAVRLARPRRLPTPPDPRDARRHP